MAILTGAALVLASPASAGSWDSNDSNQADNRSLNDRGADYVEEAGKDTWVESYTDSAADSIRSMDDDNEYDSGNYSSGSEAAER